MSGKKGQKRGRRKQPGATTAPSAPSPVDLGASPAGGPAPLDPDVTGPVPLEQGFIEVDFSDEGPDDDGKSSGRRQARIPVAERVEVSGFFGVEREQRVSDVSLGGVFVETPRVLEVGDPVLLAFPDRVGKIRVAGRVRWVTPFGGLKDARAGMGIELVGATEDQRERIFQLLRGKRARP